MGVPPRKVEEFPWASRAVMRRRGLGRLDRTLPDDRFLLTPPPPIPGNDVRVLEDGSALYPAMLEAIASARDWVVLETYIFRSDRTGWEFADALGERARAGVRVRLLIDAVGSLGIDRRLLASLRADGVEVREYHPLAPWKLRWSWLARDHRKILVVDGSVAFAGSTNIDDCHLPIAEGGQGWHDLAFEVRGPAAKALARLFEQSWRRASRVSERLRRASRGDVPPPTPGDGPAAVPGGIAVQVVGHQPIRDRYRVRSAYLHAINQASRRVRLMHSYFVPDRAVRNALCRAARSGVSVELILPARSDVLIVDLASSYLFGQLLKAGVRIWLWERGVLHSKVAVVDGVWAAVGSYNFDAQSMMFNLEVSLHVADRRLGRDLEDRFERDRQHCRPMLLEEWTGRPLLRRMLEWAAYQLRRWL